MDDPLRYILGLGNPGPRYVATRHNLGFLCLDMISAAYRAGSEFRLVDKKEVAGQARWEIWELSTDKSVVLIWPLTFMNLAGHAIDYLSTRLGPPTTGLLVLVDDMSLPLGRLRLKPSGSSGGHNGLKSIEKALGHQHYDRLRLGIGSPPLTEDVISFVLSPFESAEEPRIHSSMSYAATIAGQWAQEVPMATLMERANGWHYDHDKP